MSWFGELAELGSDCWNGRLRDIPGDFLGVASETGRIIPGASNVFPTGAEVREVVNGHDNEREHQRSGGNLGSRIGTVAGGVLGSGLGPLGTGLGMALGSAAGGWISDQFQSQSPATPARGSGGAATTGGSGGAAAAGGSGGHVSGPVAAPPTATLTPGAVRQMSKEERILDGKAKDRAGKK